MQHKKRWIKGIRWGVAASAFVAVTAGVLIGPAQLLEGQFTPAVLGLFASVSLMAVATLIGLLALTFFYGRFYCSLVCPLGIAQDILSAWSMGKAKPTRGSQGLRYAIAGLVWGACIGGWAGGLALLDPYANFGRMLAFSTLFGLLAVGVLLILGVWKKRFLCATLCPIGTFLGLLSKLGFYRLALNDRCVKCGKCAKSCPVGCIDIAHGTVDNERCVRCMQCFDVCPTEGVIFTRKAAPMDSSRRAFVTQSALLVAGLGVGVGVGVAARKRAPSGILPPGAGNAQHFAAKCIACQRCVTACPSGILVPTLGGVGPIAVDLSRGHCQFDCNRCGAVCPTGAILPLRLMEKQRTQIAVATFDAKKCKVFQADELCGECAHACPTHAITLRKTGAPRPVKTALCIGCGACLDICPSAYGKAFTLQPVTSQRLLPKA